MTDLFDDLEDVVKAKYRLRDRAKVARNTTYNDVYKHYLQGREKTDWENAKSAVIKWANNNGFPMPDHCEELCLYPRGWDNIHKEYYRFYYFNHLRKEAGLYHITRKAWEERKEYIKSHHCEERLYDTKLETRTNYKPQEKKRE